MNGNEPGNRVLSRVTCTFIKLPHLGEDILSTEVIIMHAHVSLYDALVDGRWVCSTI